MSFEEQWVESDNLPVLDRSTLEEWANCPQQAALMAAGKAVRESGVLNAGVEVHEALAVGVREYVVMDGEVQSGELVDTVMGSADISRPDVQPDVISALRPSLWAWAKFVAHELHPDNVLRFDGGIGERSGQLAVDLDWPAVRVTSELDLLYTGPSPEVLHEVDYKSGYKQWTSRDVAESFQFQMHAYLVFCNYPAVNCLEVTIWNTRTNFRTYRVMFHRKDMATYRARVTHAAKLWSESQNKPIDQVAAWPEGEKCAMCAVSPHCHRVKATYADPVDLLRQLVVLEAAGDKIKKQLGAIVKSTKRDIVTPEGDAFGQCKPASSRAKPNAVYSVTSPIDGDE